MDKPEETPEAFTADLRPLANYFGGFMILCWGLSDLRSLADHLRWCPVAIINSLFFLTLHTEKYGVAAIFTQKLL